MIETFLLRVFSCDNPESGRSLYGNIFRDSQAQWAKLRYVNIYFYLNMKLSMI